MTFLLSIMSALFAGAAAIAMLRTRFPEPHKSRAPSSRRSQTQAFARTLARSVARALPLAKKDENALRSKLAQAGIVTSPAVFYGASLSFFGLSCTGALIAHNALPDTQPALLKPALCLFSTAAAASVPFALVSLKASRRKKGIEAELPTTLDMLAASVEAGLTFERSIRIVSSRRTGPLSEELIQTDRDVSVLGFSRSQALERMAKRCGSEEVSLFASSVIASSSSGAPLARMLKGLAQAARKRRFQKMEAEANKIPTKMVFPLAFLIMPSTFLVAMAPAGISIANNAMEVL